jgi:hypothetical protein
MLKRDEIEDTESCLNKATDGERLFVLLARDPAAPVAIRAWIAERIRLGKNTPSDEQIHEAHVCAQLMELERSEIVASRRQQQLCWTSSVIPVSKFSSAWDGVSSREYLVWSEFAAMLSEPVRSACTLASCEQGSCAHKRGAGWSPAVFSGGGSRRDQVESISLLVFDVDLASDDQIDEIRERISGYRYLIHGTHSDRPHVRFVRIVVSLSRPVIPDEWPGFWAAARQTLAPIADSTSDVSRIYFMPSCAGDAGYFVQVNEGVALDVDAMLVSAFAAQVAEPSSSVGSEVAP